jgi:hypothetical protein
MSRKDARHGWGIVEDPKGSNIRRARIYYHGRRCKRRAAVETLDAPGPKPWAAKAVAGGGNP